MEPSDLACLPFLHCQACACCHCVLWAEPVRPVLGGAGPGLVYSRERKTCLIRKSAGPGCPGSSSGPRWDQPLFVESTELAPHVAAVPPFPSTEPLPAGWRGWGLLAQPPRSEGRAPGLGVGAGVLAISPVSIFLNCNSLSALRKMIKEMKFFPLSRLDTSLLLNKIKCKNR